jgi:hypothetical protein
MRKCKLNGCRICEYCYLFLGVLIFVPLFSFHDDDLQILKYLCCLRLDRILCVFGHVLRLGYSGNPT